jgi:hypothetical protein
MRRITRQQIVRRARARWLDDLSGMDRDEVYPALKRPAGEIRDALMALCPETVTAPALAKALGVGAHHFALYCDDCGEDSKAVATFGPERTGDALALQGRPSRYCRRCLKKRFGLDMPTDQTQTA